MHLDRLWITDFRNYLTAELAPAPVGLTAIVGNNGEGKTNLLEAVGYLATLRSFRGAPPEALVRTGAEAAIVRAEAERDSRRLLIEAELRPDGRDRVQVNRQPLRRTRDLLGALQVTVFAPDDLALVKAGPQGRRDYLDDLLVALHPRHDALRSDLDRILRQRNALLKQAAGNPRPPADIVTTLDVWDPKLADTGTAVADARAGLLVALGPELASVYDHVAERAAHVHRRATSAAGAARWPRPWRRLGATTCAAGVTTARAPARRPGRDPGRPALAHPRLPGRAALPGPGPAPGRPLARSPGAGQPPAAAARRRVLRARR